MNGNPIRCDATTVDEFLSLDNLNNCLSVKAVFHIKEVADLIKDSKVEHKTWMNEMVAVDVEKMIRAHLVLTMFLSS